jgi:hypothetical protein
MDMINEALLNKLKQLLRIGDTINHAYTELETLLSQNVFSESPPTSNVLSCAEVFAGERTLKEISINDGKPVCEELKKYSYNTIKFYTIPGSYCIALERSGSASSRSYCLSTLKDILELACNLSEEDIDKLIEAAKYTLNSYSETIEKLKQLLALVRMVLS